MKRRCRGLSRGACAGVTLIEVLIAVVVTVIGLLGIVALQMRSYASETESYQRAQAAILLEDMANRIRANGDNASAYVADNIGVGPAESCAGLAPRAAQDMCEWGNLLRGAAESHDGASIGAMTEGRACISLAATDLYLITVAWAGSVASAAPAAACGSGAFSDEKIRRALSTVVRIADLGG
jgi:type IV pilus assembly protein PilV